MLSWTHGLWEGICLSLTLHIKAKYMSSVKWDFLVMTSKCGNWKWRTEPSWKKWKHLGSQIGTQLATYEGLIPSGLPRWFLKRNHCSFMMASLVGRHTWPPEPGDWAVPAWAVAYRHTHWKGKYMVCHDPVQHSPGCSMEHGAWCMEPGTEQCYMAREGL